MEPFGNSTMLTTKMGALNFQSNRIYFLLLSWFFSSCFCLTSGTVHADRSCRLCRFCKHTEAQQNNLLEFCSCDRLENPSKSQGFTSLLYSKEPRPLPVLTEALFTQTGTVQLIHSQESLCHSPRRPISPALCSWTRTENEALNPARITEHVG